MIIRRRFTWIALTGMTLAALAGCSGSSSSGGTPKTTAPSGENTAKAVKTESFHGISAKVNHALGFPLPTLRGVESESYSPQTHTLTVVYRTTADKTDQDNVENIVREYKQKALAKPSKSAKPSTTPKASASA